MKMKSIVKKLLIMSLCGLLFGCGIDKSERVVLVAGSDFQQNQISSYADNSLKKLIQRVASSGYEIDRLIFCGDYVYDNHSTSESMRLMKDLVSDTVSSEKLVFVQGNHDDADLFDESVIEDEQYSIFLLHEMMMPFCAENDDVIVKTADTLTLYLQDKIEMKETRVVFIASHLPLHYTKRTYNDSDVQFAEAIYDVINDAAKKGLNIVYLYGHNHSNGYDDYLGGASVFLQKGDMLHVAKYGQPKAEPVEKELNFTYMNAGYLSGYSTSESSVDKNSTVSVFVIENGKLNIMRFDEQGRHQLKSAGVYNSKLPECLNQECYEKSVR